MINEEENEEEIELTDEEKENIAKQIDLSKVGASVKEQLGSDVGFVLIVVDTNTQAVRSTSNIKRKQKIGVVKVALKSMKKK